MPLCVTVSRRLTCSVLFCYRMSVTCRRLEHLYLTSSTVNCEAVLTALLKTELGISVSGHHRRTIYLGVPSE